MSGWISVEDRLPELYIRVMIATKGRGVTIGSREQDGFVWLGCERWWHEEARPDEPVTHWQYYPEPPMEDK